MRADIIILICLSLVPAILVSAEKNETFVPTREWQTVKKGTPIPGGLHVRHNFQTGVTEAKLMDNGDTEENNANGSTNHSHSKSLTLHPEKAVPYSKDDELSNAQKLSDLLSSQIKELKTRLRELEQNDVETPAELNEGDAPKAKHKFRDYETLKRELKALEINVTTDSDLLKNYFQKFQAHKNAITMGTLTLLEIEDVLDILYNLEYLLHHIDNAQAFTDMQGMTKIISPCLNGTNNEIKAEALRVLGAAVQSHPKVQTKALENEFVQKLLQILSTNNKVEVKSRCLYALSALIRQFPAAQKVWVNHGGLEIFGKILADDQLQIQMKVMKLINDLITERQNLKEVTDLEQRQQRTRRYAAIDMERKLLAYEYCKHLSNLMTKIFKNELVSEFSTDNYEFLEVISESMITITPICKSHFAQNKESLVTAIWNLLTFFRDFEMNNPKEENDVLKNLVLLIQKLRKTLFEITHDEL